MSNSLVVLYGKIDSGKSSTLMFHHPDITIGACRPSGDRRGAIKAIHSYSEDVISDIASQIWIPRDSENYKTQAQELLDDIDSYCTSGKSITITLQQKKQ